MRRNLEPLTANDYIRQLQATNADLLAALEMVLDTFQSLAREGIDMDTFNRGGIGHDAVIAVAAAIAKARG